MRKSRINRRTVRKQNKRKSKRQQRGGKIVLPMRYFTDNFTDHYYADPGIAEGQVATSHGVSLKGQQMTGPDLRIAAPVKQQGGGVMPAEFYGGNSQRYFEAGAPELLNCETPYGRAIATSHGVVMDAPNNQWMGPNLATMPNATKTQLGGGYGMGCGCAPKSNKRKKGSKKKKGKKGGVRKRTRTRGRK